MNGSTTNSNNLQVVMVGPEGPIGESTNWGFVPQIGSTISLDDKRYVVMHVDNAVVDGDVTSYVDCISVDVPVGGTDDTDG